MGMIVQVFLVGNRVSISKLWSRSGKGPLPGWCSERRAEAGWSKQTWLCVMRDKDVNLGRLEGSRIEKLHLD